ncbi:hypothetical protein [Sphingobium sp. SA916]|uniref:hypothetical protein n=1 Tax=Sphingobium sp. SA916 TaxID=1851207 RepID=UPI000C9EDDAE|nr:hypothetical protein [Sphingobium sp. SA916]PNQ02127.1 hypothetical protein A8G00_14125 [Sphingobium sp. SA916]
MLSHIIANAAQSVAAEAVRAGPGTIAPPSFNEDPSLFLFNLFIMTAATFLGAMMAGKQANRIWIQRLHDHPLDPVTLYRAIAMLAGLGLTLRCGAAAMELWGWNPHDPTTTARILMAKRWIDPIAVGCGFLWMAIVILGEPGIEHQLRKAPLPVDMWSRWPDLMRAGAIIVLSFVAAMAAVCLR